MYLLFVFLRVDRTFKHCHYLFSVDLTNYLITMCVTIHVNVLVLRTFILTAEICKSKKNRVATTQPCYAGRCTQIQIPHPKIGHD